MRFYCLSNDTKIFILAQKYTKGGLILFTMTVCNMIDPTWPTWGNVALVKVNIIVTNYKWIYFKGKDWKPLN